VNPLSRLVPYWHFPRERFSRAGRPPGSSSCLLPFNENPVVATYLFTAFFFGILSDSGGNPSDGLLNLYLQLSAPRGGAADVSVLPLKFLPTIPVDKLGLLDTHDWPAGEVDRMGKGGLVAAMVGALEEGHYLYVHLNYFYLANTEFFRRHHFRQSALVIGFDSAAREFRVACYLRNGLFGVTRVPSLLVADAFYSPLGRANSAEASRVNRLHCMRRPESAPGAAQLDVNAIKWQLLDYVEGTNVAPRRMDNRVIRDWSERFDKSTPADTHYGSQVYDGIIELLRAVDLNTLEKVDYRITRLLWEHKKLMAIRIRRLIETGALADPSLPERWAEVEYLAWSLHFNLFKSVTRRDPIDPAAAEAALRELQDRERGVLAGVCEALDRF
jgi:hypothetical protein